MGSEQANRSQQDASGVFVSLVHNAPHVVTILDENGIVRYVNLPVEQALGYSRENLVGGTALDLVHPEDAKRTAEAFSGILAHEGTRRVEVENRVRHADGSWRPMHSVATNLLADPDVRGIVVHSRAAPGPAGKEGPLRLQRQLLDAVGQSVVAFDLEGKIFYWNRAAEEMYGWAAEEVVGRPWEDIGLSDDQARLAEEVLTETMARGRWSGEMVVRDRRGAKFPVSATNTPLRDERGNLVGFVGVSTDGTRQEEYRRRVVESERRLASVVSDAHAYVYRCLNEPNWPNEYASDYALEITGYPPEDLMVGGEVSFGDLVVEDDRERVWEGVQEALAEGRAFELRYAIRRKDGQVRHVHEHGRGVYEEDGGVVALEGLVYDVTEHTETEERLRKAEERYRTLVERIPAVTYIDRADVSGEPVYVSPQVEHMLGYTPEEWMAGRLWRGRLHPEDRERIAAADERFWAHGGGTDEEYRLLAKDGSVVWVREETVLVRGEGGEPLYVQGILTDTTERREAEEGLWLRDRAISATSDGVVITDPNAPDNPIVYVNPAFERITGYAAGEALGRNCRFLQDGDRDQPALDDLGEAVREGRGWRGVLRNYRKDGTPFFNELRLAPVRDGAGRLVNFVGVQTDATDRMGSERALRESESSLAAAQRIAHVGNFAYSVERDEARWSDELYRVFGYVPRQFVPTYKTFLRSVHRVDRDLVRSAVRGALFGGKRAAVEYRIVRPNGETRVVRSAYEVVRDQSGRAVNLVGTVHDVTERKALEDQLRQQALHDPLTGLPNRLLLKDRLRQALARTERRRDSGLAVLFMDLDNFKDINDSLGHGAGDLLLVAVAERLGGLLRPEDTLARFGGDEFVVLLEDVSGPDGATRVAERISEGFGHPFSLEGRDLYARASIGIALGDARTKGPEDLLRDADTAMYRAKEENPGRFSVFDPAMHERASGRLELENGLRRAIEREEFVVQYQPIVRLDGGAVCAVEALVRWEHPERGLLGPDEFVPVAEQSGLIVPIGERVLLEACRTGKRWQQEHPRMPPLVMSVNLSARQLSRPDLAETVEGALGETGLEARSLSLDVTETSYVGALEGNTGALARLRAMGVGVSIDDFGTGYSSLAYLKRLPADAVKIDRSFVAGLGEDIEDTAIVGMVIDLAHTLGMEAIAEGVETAEQAALLKEMGCDMAQGYFLSKPLFSEAMALFLAR